MGRGAPWYCPHGAWQMRANGLTLSHTVAGVAFGFVAVLGLVGCRAVLGVEDLHVDADGSAGDAGGGGDAFAACSESCRSQFASASTAFYSNSAENCLCNNKIPRQCVPECNQFCNSPDPINLTAPCRYCIQHDALAATGVCANVQCGGGSGGCTSYVNCVKACPR